MAEAEIVIDVSVRLAGLHTAPGLLGTATAMAGVDVVALTIAGTGCPDDTALWVGDPGQARALAEALTAQAAVAEQRKAAEDA